LTSEVQDPASGQRNRNQGKENAFGKLISLPQDEADCSSFQGNSFPEPSLAAAAARREINGSEKPDCSQAIQAVCRRRGWRLAPTVGIAHGAPPARAGALIFMLADKNKFTIKPAWERLTQIKAREALRWWILYKGLSHKARQLLARRRRT